MTDDKLRAARPDHNHPRDSLCLVSACPRGAWNAALAASATDEEREALRERAEANWRRSIEAATPPGVLLASATDGPLPLGADPNYADGSPRPAVPEALDVERLKEAMRRAWPYDTDIGVDPRLIDGTVLDVAREYAALPSKESA